MKIFFSIKHYVFTALREILVYHHSSLEFRAKVFALIVAANQHPTQCDYSLVHEAGMRIYKDKDRAKMLLLTTKEYVDKVHKQGRLDIDHLVEEIRSEVRQIPRYSTKIDISLLQPLIECTTDEDTSTYQIRMLEFLEELKKEYTIT